MVTEKQARILHFVEQYCADHGYSPTLENIALAMAVCKATIQGHVRRLVRLRLLARDGKSRRSLKLTEAALSLLEPGAYALNAALANATPATSPAARAFAQGLGDRDARRQCYTIGDEGLRGDGVRHGDLVIIDTSLVPREKDLVIVAESSGALTVRRFTPQAAPGGEPDGDPAPRLVGVLIGLWRAWHVGNETETDAELDAPLLP